MNDDVKINKIKKTSKMFLLSLFVIVGSIVFYDLLYDIIIRLFGNPDSSNRDSISYKFISLIITQILCVLVIVFVVKYKNINKLYLPMRLPEPTVMFFYIGWTFLFVASNFLYAYFFNQAIFSGDTLKPYNHGFYQPIWWFIAIISAPVFEEFLFRGVFYKLIKDLVNYRVAIFFTALIWVIIHNVQEVSLFIEMLIFGLLLGYVRYKTESITLTIMLHSINNVAVTFIVFLNI